MHLLRLLLMAWLALGIASLCSLFWLCKRTDVTAKEQSKLISFSPQPAEFGTDTQSHRCRTRAASALSMLKRFDARAFEAFRQELGVTPFSSLPVTDLPDRIDSAWPTTLPVGKPDKADRQTLPNPGKPHPSGPVRQDTG